MIENWKDVEGYGGLYQVSDLGNVKSLKKMKGAFEKPESILKLKIRKDNGYCDVRLCKNNKAKSFLVHRLIARHFIPNPNNRPQINHINGNKLDNRVSNLEWVTSSENLKHAFKIGLQRQDGENHATLKLNWEKVREIRRRAANGDSSRRMSEEYGVHYHHVNAIIANTYWKEKTV